MSGHRLPGCVTTQVTLNACFCFRTSVTFIRNIHYDVLQDFNLRGEHRMEEELRKQAVQRYIAGES